MTIKEARDLMSTKKIKTMMARKKSKRSSRALDLEKAWH